MSQPNKFDNEFPVDEGIEKFCLVRKSRQSASIGHLIVKFETPYDIKLISDANNQSLP